MTAPKKKLRPCRYCLILFVPPERNVRYCSDTCRERNRLLRGPPKLTAEQRYRAYAQNATKRGLVWELTQQQYEGLRSGVCHYCGVGGSVGIDRMDPGLGYVQGNCVSCCKTCNFMKGQLGYEEFLQQVTAIAQHR